jgi:two-component system cell cycle sensor histidine kinase/response regulator CckA
VHRFPVDWQPQGELFACLMVKDTGSGIAAKDIDKLFDPFFTSKFAGRGLGLAIVLGILKMHKGMITVESEPGHGSVFQAFFPLSMEHVVLQSDNATQGSSIVASHAVLLIEDEQPMREMLEIMLARLGFVVFAARDGVEAIEIFRKHQNDIHIVLCDISMSGMDGWETLATLRTMVPTIPAIFISGHDEAQVMQSEQSECPQAFLQKPFKKEDLRGVLATVLPS